MNDAIIISDLELQARIGVPETERQQPQRLTASLVLELPMMSEALDDQIGRAVDYATVCERVKILAADSRCELIETLAASIARQMLEQFAVVSVEVELRKYILPDTAYVAVRLRR